MTEQRGDVATGPPAGKAGPTAARQKPRSTEEAATLVKKLLASCPSYKTLDRNSQKAIGQNLLERICWPYQKREITEQEAWRIWNELSASLKDTPRRRGGDGQSAENREPASILPRIESPRHESRNAPHKHSISRRTYWYSSIVAGCRYLLRLPLRLAFRQKGVLGGAQAPNPPVPESPKLPDKPADTEAVWIPEPRAVDEEGPRPEPVTAIATGSAPDDQNDTATESGVAVQTESDEPKAGADFPDGPPRPAWRVLEPEDKTDPVPHALHEFRQRNNKWNVVAASVRGKLHAHRGTYREDAYGMNWVDDWTILVVSDGAGSASLSRVGASLACQAALHQMTESLAGYKLGEPNEDKDSPPQDELLRVRDFLVAAACQSQEAIVREAQTRGCKPKDLHATLLLLIHTPWQGRDLVGAIQVGDGTIGVLTDDDVCTIMGVSDYGEFSSETRFLTTPDIESEFEQRVRFTVRTGVRCIAAMCDGVADDFFPEGKRLVELFLGNPIPGLKTKDGGALLGLLRQALKEPREGMAVREWLEYEKRGSSDDRTLVAMYRRDLV